MFEPITDLKTAEAYFRAMGCSAFHMCREWPERYEEYVALGVSREQEHEWRLAEFQAQIDQIRGAAEPADLASLHSSAACLIRDTGDAEARGLLEKFVIVTEDLVSRVPDADRIIVAETVVGRNAVDSQHPDGPLPRSLKLGAHELAERYRKLVKAFADGTLEIPDAVPLNERRRSLRDRLRALN